MATVSKSVTVVDGGTYTLELNAIPTGSTVTPINDIQTWLHCADIWDKNYTTLNQVLADAGTLQALIASNNAADYMARSTSWASSVCANTNAMAYIGANNYCANKLLSNSTWLNAICNSTYMESVLNIKVPTMTGYTTPSGEVKDGNHYGSQEGWYAFNGVANPAWLAYIVGGYANLAWVQYDFTRAVKVRAVKLDNTYYTTNFVKEFKIQGSNDNSTFVDIYTGQTSSNTSHSEMHSFVNNTAYRYYRIKCISIWVTTENLVSIANMNFYGRA